MIRYQKAPVLFLHNGITNMSKSFNGLVEQIKSEIKRDPKEGELYIFFNAARDKVKMIFNDGTGWVIVYKKLSNAHFAFDKSRGYKKLIAVNPEGILSQFRK